MDTDRINAHSSGKDDTTNNKRSNLNSSGKVSQVPNQDGFFLTEDPNQHDGKVEMQAQDAGVEENQEESRDAQTETPGNAEEERTEGQQQEFDEVRHGAKEYEVSAEDYGKWKIDKFKAFARDILLPVSHSQ